MTHKRPNPSVFSAVPQTPPRNEAAERLRRVLIDFDYERHVTTLQDALAEERRHVIEQIRERGSQPDRSKDVIGYGMRKGYELAVRDLMGDRGEPE